MGKRKKNSGDTSFLGELLYAFRNGMEKIRSAQLSKKFVERQRSLSGYEDKNSPREAKVAYAFGILRAFSVVLLCVFLCLVLLFGKSIITYENVYYMFKDIGYINSYDETVPDSLSFSEPVSNQTFTTFKNGLAVAGDSEIKFFTSTGRATLTEGSDFTNPRILSSDSSVLIYDQGKTSFSVYNSFICIHSETLKYPISYADMASDGSFCIVTRSLEYGSVVRVYNSSFAVDMEYSKNDYVISAQMSDDGRFIAVLSLSASGGESNVSLNILKRGERNVYSSVSVKGLMPYSAEFIGNDRIALVCSESTSVYDLSCNRKSLIEYPGKLSYTSFTEDGFALSFEINGNGSENIVSSYDKNGSLKFTDRLSGYIYDMEIENGNIYVLCNDRIIHYTESAGKISEIEFYEEGACIVTFSNGRVMVCTAGVAYYIPF